ncbi:MAG: c-type cytochrome [Gammaproteobacteria bacterium]|nr:MAG: c-type cytochrome [Gammaproteobacteria bacterium]
MMSKTLLTTALMMFAFMGVIPIGAQAAGDAEAGKGKSVSCQGCHGTLGNSANPAWPKLAGQHEGYIAKQLRDFKNKTRVDASMASMVINLSEQDMADVGAYFASQSVKVGTVDKKFLELGEKIYRGGLKEKGLPACMSCHGPSGAGNPAANFPALSGQHAVYTAKTLQDFNSGKRQNDQNGMMQDIAARMSSKEIEAVANYINGLY